MHYNQIKRPRFKIFPRLSACIRFSNELFQKLFIISVAHKSDYRLNMNINLNAARYGQLALVLKHFLYKYNRYFTGLYICSASNGARNTVRLVAFHYLCF